MIWFIVSRVFFFLGDFIMDEIVCVIDTVKDFCLQSSEGFVKSRGNINRIGDFVGLVFCFNGGVLVCNVVKYDVVCGLLGNIYFFSF